MTTGTATLIDGRQVADAVAEETAQAVTEHVARGHAPPHLTAVLVGDDAASAVYVRNKGRACERVGMTHETLALPAATTQAELLAHIERLNASPAVSGILVQMPLPPQIDASAVMSAVDPRKDVDGLHPVNMGLLLAGTPGLVPATPAGVQQLLLRTGHDPDGRRVVIVGRSVLVGRPLAALLANKAPGANATVTIAHTGTRDLGAVTREAEILVVAAGRAGIVTAEMVRPGAVVIDVGTNRVDDPTAKRGYRLTGDVDFAAVSEIAAAITPVPGGVGPMTIAMVVRNTLVAAQGLASGVGGG
ncbi:MAG: bifunctional 5,10-methylenetetrahydrofolate dehydrogenase/5,10-methenyltetrahydrofolate cyclohydrolase [Chloroflexi bacterium]|nr:bifunctional 5,10-methylenetetrahydrofolate dehydrogenase/5,10-methenyltetrahydrofolate cyclohydrolase [Chloroflexota bacterium]